MVCLPAAVAAFGRDRGYLGPGACPAGVGPVLKVIGAVGGDEVELGATAVTRAAARPRSISTTPTLSSALGPAWVAADEV